jgi:DNA processing protein
VTGAAGRPDPRPPDGAYAAALATLPDVGPATLRRLLATAAPAEAWARIVEGHPLDLEGRWKPVARGTDVAGGWSALCRLGIGALYLGGPGYPAALASDHGAPAVLFHLGDASLVDDRSRVGVVGTRTATRYGLGVAAQIGAELAAAGVAVVSGLAVGIDTAAHEGAVAGWEAGRPGAAPPIAVVAGGLDVPYPRSSARLWDRVAAAGVVLSESPAGTGGERWRFPKRNRILAAMSQVLVVVECHQRGGSLHTVRAAVDRGVPVGAVPGSVRSPASAGTNDLLADGCFPVRDVTDVLVALDLARATAVPVRERRPSGRPRRATGEVPGVGPRSGTASGRDRAGVGALAAASVAEAGPAPAGERGGPLSGAPGVPVIEAIGWDRCTLDQILRRTGRPLAEVSLEIERCAARGEIHGDGTWWQRS